MKIGKKIVHWILPHESNNQKPKLLHSSGLLFLKVLLVSIQVAIYFSSTSSLPNILGYAANISPSEVIRLTNEKRQQVGLGILTENPTLSQAALAKGNDMLLKDYWAHVSPDGTQPWFFFTNAGYSYRYAGENLARDFSNASSAVEAWMASPSHRDNLLSSNYKEIGIGVVEGDMAGVDTTIIVQFFGTKYADQVTTPVAQVGAVEDTGNGSPVPVATLTPTGAPESTPEPSSVPVAVTSDGGGGGLVGSQGEFLVSPFDVTKNTSLVIVGSLLSILSVDALVTSKRRVKRIGGRSFAHISFLGMVLSIILILKAGQIL